MQFGQQVVEKCKTIQTENLQSEWKQLLSQQKEVTRKVEEYLQTLGIIERQSEDGLNTIRNENGYYKELSNAEQILKTQTQKLSCQYS